MEDPEWADPKWPRFVLRWQQKQMYLPYQRTARTQLKRFMTHHLQGKVPDSRMPSLRVWNVTRRWRVLKCSWGKVGYVTPTVTQYVTGVQPVRQPAKQGDLQLTKRTIYDLFMIHEPKALLLRLSVYCHRSHNHHILNVLHRASICKSQHTLIKTLFCTVQCVLYLLLIPWIVLYNAPIPPSVNPTPILLPIF